MAMNTMMMAKRIAIISPVPGFQGFLPRRLNKNKPPA